MRGSFPGGRMAIRDESGPQPPSSVRFKIEWSYISTPP
jgi:hypothetical protein